MQSLVIVVVRVASMASKLILSAFIASYFGLEDLGNFGVLVGIVSVVPVLTSLGFVHVVSRDAARNQWASTLVDIHNYWAISCVFYGVAAAWCGLSGQYQYILVLAICMFSQFSNDLFHIRVNKNQQFGATVTFFVSSSAWVFAYIPSAYLLPELRTLPIIQAFWLSFAILAVSPLLLEVKSKFGQPLAQYVKWAAQRLKNAYVLFISDVSFVGSQYLDRFVVIAFLGSTAAGEYFLYWTLAGAATTLASVVIMQKFRPSLINMGAVGTRYEFWSLAVRGFISTVSVSGGLTLLSATMIVVVSYLLVLPWFDATVFLSVAAASVFRGGAEYWAMVLFAKRYDREMTITNAAGLVGYLIANVFFITNTGIIGAAISTIGVSMALGAWRVWIVARK